MIAPLLAAALAASAFIASLALAQTQTVPAQPVHAQAQPSPVAQPAQSPPAKAMHASCFSAGEAREAVGAKRVIAPNLALRAARQQGFEALRARLCTHNAKPAYFVTSLAKDGKVVWIVVDATTGTVVEKR